MELLSSSFKLVAARLASSSAHALLLAGRHGVAPLLEAEYLAEALVMARGGSRQTLTPEADKTGLSITQIRSLYLATRSKRVSGVMVWLVLLDGAADAAQNALLKLLEEPPGGTVFIIVVSNNDNALATIRSRCQTVALPTYDTQAAEAWLSVQGVANAAVRQQLLFLAEGSISELQRLASDDAYQKSQLDNAASAKLLISGTVYQRLQAMSAYAADREQTLRILHITIAMLSMVLERQATDGLRGQLERYVGCYERIQHNGNVRAQLLAAITARG